MDVEPALFRRAFDRGVDIELVGRPFAREAAKAPQGHLDIAGAQLLGVVEVLELALVPHLDRALVSAFAADPHTLGVVAGIAEGRGSARADPFVAALMALFLLLKPLLERVHDLVPVTQRLDLLHLFFGEEFLGHGLEPVFRHLDRVLAVIGQDSLEDLLKDLIEAIEQPFVLNEGGAAEIIEGFRRFFDHLPVERLEQGQVFLETGGNARLAQLVDEIEEHDRCSIGDAIATPAQERSSKIESVYPVLTKSAARRARDHQWGTAKNGYEATGRACGKGARPDS